MAEEIIVIKRKVIRASAKKKSLPDMEFDNISWAIKARSDDETRTDIHCILIQGNKIVASNGAVLCISKIAQEYPSGCYDVLLASWRLIVLEKVDAKFPEYDKLIPSDIPEVTGEINGDFTSFLSQVYRLASYDVKYLQMVFMDEQFFFEYREGEKPLKPLVLKNIGGDNWTRMAFVMPRLER